MFKTRTASAIMATASLVAVLGMQGTAPGAEGGLSLVINEVMASNTAALKDPQGQFDDWIEIHNSGTVAADLGGLYLTDDVNSPTRWQIPLANPSLTTIAPQGYLLIWVDGDSQDPGLHAGFKLDSGAFRHGLQGFLEIPAFLLHHEAEDVAALVALAETVPGLPVGRDDERGGFLVVERAQAGIVLAGAAQFNRFPDQVYDVNAGFDFVELGHGVREL